MSRNLRSFLARCAGVAACGSMLTFSMPGTSYATTFTLDGSAGTINGLSSTTINGVTISYENTTAGVATFEVFGDLDLLSGDVLNTAGSAGINLLVGNNVNIDSGATVSVTAGTAGGGSGASGWCGRRFDWCRWCWRWCRRKPRGPGWRHRELGHKQHRWSRWWYQSGRWSRW